jgi:hypothetical protein
MEEFVEYLPFVIPILLVQLILMISALVHVLRHKKYRFGTTLLWSIVVVIFSIIGPILYFTLGREEE